MNKNVKKDELTIAELKKELAEKTRQLEIESALEKVRSRSLGMRQSDELKEVVKVMFEQLQHLGISFDFASIDLFIDGSKDLYSYSCGWLGSEFFINGRYTCYFDHPIMNDIVDARESGIQFHVKTYTKEEINSALEYAFEHTEIELEDNVKAQMLLNAGYTIARAFGKNCAVNINNWSAKGINDSEKNILIRFAKVFEQVYNRFLDLQKAEEQAREAQIEAALERVRSRAIGMQKSEELREVAQVIFDQLRALDFKVESANFAVGINETNDFRGWLTAPGYQYASRIDVPYLDHPVFNRMLEAKEKGDHFYTLLLTKEEKNHFFDHYFKFAPMPEERKSEIYDCGGWALSVVPMKTIALSITNYVPLPYSEEQNKTIVRFGNAFEQVYTRFLDLQRAEAQAKEAQIEAALERVRSRSMAMQKSEELREVIQLILDQLCGLHFNIDAASFTIEFNESNDLKMWLAAPGQRYAARIDIPYIDHPIFSRVAEAKKKGENFFTIINTKEEKNRFLDHFFKYAAVTEERKKMLYNSAGLTQLAVLMKAVALTIYNYSAIPYSEEQNTTLARFGKSFEQTYTRFLDLQKVEAQAREAQIEAALERVRSRSMGMQKSEELREVIQLILDQLLGLNFSIDSASFVVEIDESNDFRTWMAAPGQQYAARVDLPYLDHPNFNRGVEARKKGETFYTLLLTREEKDQFFDHFFKYAPVTEERKKVLYSSAGWSQSSVLMKTLALNIQNYSAIAYSEEQNNTLLRFGKAFEQTYTRFLDLQKVEAQAREAQIEAALERVRSRAMAMQKSEELREVIQVIFDQLCRLDFDIDAASFVVEINESDDLRNWVAVPGQKYSNRINLPYLNHPIFNQLIKVKEKGQDFYTLTCSKDEKDKFFDHFFKYAPVMEERRKVIYNRDGWAQSAVLMKTLGLSIQNYSGIPYSEDQDKTLVRFGKAFEQTYTRFLDLQKAEANAKEAVKQASIDRVRAEIASMRTTKDLDRIIPLIWNELTILHIPFIRCGVFIVNEDAEQTQVYLSTPEGKAIATFQLPFDSDGLNKEMLEHWRKSQIFKEHWDAATFLAWTHTLVEAGAIQPDERHSNEQPPENLYLHFVPFIQGMLYVGNTEPLSADELRLIESLADAFSTAYARYEDFSKLEMAKQQIETTLTELKATQSQLIQSEKMASLGELTAGIAHEIQNPLNFVNNFSEVSSELVVEMEDALHKDYKEEAIAIAGDIRENLEKINNHGKRADAIVKGMLQHSRANAGKKELTDINALADEYLRLSYHGLRAKDKDFDATLETKYDEGIGKIEMVPQDIGRVLLNLYNNAFYAVNDRCKVEGVGYKPTVAVTTKRAGDKVEITVKDNGNGIPQKVVDKIFQPFFTTKPTGQGTGLGLSLSYDIVKAHGGELNAETTEGEGAEFIIQLPVLS